VALLQTFAAQAVIAIENVRLFNETKEALEQQTATAEILQVISSSPTDVQPTFDAIAASATRLCEAEQGTVFRFDGRLIHMVAHNGGGPLERETLQRLFPRLPGRGTLTSRAILTGSVQQADIAADPEHEHPEIAAFWGTVLSVPMLREAVTIGAITVRRRERRPFSAKQIALLETFANQAVIAIENVRLFTELQEKNRALTQAHAQATEALEQQTATSEILRAISGSPTDVQPVFDAVVRSAVRLCDSLFSAVFLFDGHQIEMAAHHGFSAVELEAARRQWPRPAARDTMTGQAILDRRIIHVRDVERDPDVPPSTREVARAVGYRSLISVPMLREGECIGSINAARARSAFTDRQIALLQTFADQAMIAIENVRLFKELQARNRELSESLEQQTATSELLKVIAASFGRLAISAGRSARPLIWTRCSRPS
jgi:two-component system, NtrC family, sensor kinase